MARLAVEVIIHPSSSWSRLVVLQAKYNLTKEVLKRSAILEGKCAMLHGLFRTVFH